MKDQFLANVGVQGTGAVVAAPDHNTPGGSYVYHWERDGALTMAALQASKLVDDSQLSKYASWVAARQAMPDPHGIDVRTEPKYEIPSGDVFSGAWCRPQNDGPGLRALALLDFAEQKWASKDEQASVYVRASLWPSIWDSLSYLVGGGWKSSTCDLWEEVRSTDFFWNRVTAKKALERGAAFATRVGNSSAAAALGAVADQIRPSVSAHFDGYIFEATNRKLDGAVIVGLNNGFDDPSPVFTPGSAMVAHTVAAYNEAFCAEYPINQADSKASLPGVLYGRYPGDQYAGGNPWILTSAALAQLLYRVSAAAASGKGPDADTLKVWSGALNAQGLSEQTAPAVFAAAGDAVLSRIAHHVRAANIGFRLDEQLDKKTGATASAKSLTWSYAEVFNALLWRSHAMAAAGHTTAAS